MKKKNYTLDEWIIPKNQPPVVGPKLELKRPEQELNESIFYIESLSHNIRVGSDTKGEKCKKPASEVLANDKELFLDPPSIYCFRGIIDTPQQAQKKEPKEFLKARLKVDEEIEKIGLGNEIRNNLVTPEHITKEIANLEIHEIPKTQLEIEELVTLNDIYRQQIASYNISFGPCFENKTIDLNKISNNSMTDLPNPSNAGMLKESLSSILKQSKENIDIDEFVTIFESL